MQFSPEFLARHGNELQFVKAPAVAALPGQQDPSVTARVEAMLTRIEHEGVDALRAYAAELDNWTGDDFLIDADDVRASGDRLPRELRKAIEVGSRRTRAFARAHRAKLSDFEFDPEPGIRTGVRYVPVGRVGAYLPAGRFPLTASAFMTVGVAKEAGVQRVIGCTPPQPDGTANAAVLYAASVSGVDAVYLLGGVQALGAMAFGLIDDPVDMLVGAGNAYVAEAKRQLFGRVAIDLLAGPSEVAVIADDSADPETVAADLLGQAEHGPDSPAALVTTSSSLALGVADAAERQLRTLATADIAGAAWRDHGSIVVVPDREAAVRAMDDLAPEHLEIITEDDEFFVSALTNYGSLFVGPWSTVAYSDKGMAGTNHVLPTAGGAKHSAGLSVSRFLRPLTWQRVDRAATPLLAECVHVISESEGMAAHAATAEMRLDNYANDGVRT